MVTVGFVSVLFVKVSEPANVAKVPVVGKVTLVAPVKVLVYAKLPDDVTVADALLATPVPPEAGDKVADKPAAVPEVFWLKVGQVNVPVLKSPDVGVPKTGVTKLGLIDNTTEPVPVLVVTPVPPLATGNVPVTPVVKGKPVKLVAVPLAGVPRMGLTSVGLLDSTTLPEPVLVVTPVPPLATAKVPAKVIVPAAVMGPPEVVRPVVPPDTATLVTVPEPPAAIHSASVAPTLTAKILPALPL